MSRLREFARRVVEGETLADKLAPAPPYDDGRGAPLRLRSPGRPRELAFTRDRAKMPHVLALRDPAKRAICLHRFANHELQAVELMAWALLAFPDAPGGFRAGVLGTLADEQRHLARYAARLAALGLPFGSLPVNDYFWSKIDDLETPLHYLAALGLTFEAGNLDHSAAYRDAFAAAGDRESAALLATIHDEEIGHVRFAANWLRKLKDPGASDWEAWTAHLKFPLRPARAKGAVFLAEPRLAAGLTPEFVAGVERA